MTEFVRVKDPGTGHEWSAPKRWAEASDEVEVLHNKRATDVNGRPLPSKPKVNLESLGDTGDDIDTGTQLSDYAPPEQNGDESR
jgi:hypothetical protein